MALSPYLRSPLSDLTGAMFNQQWFGECKNMESKLIDCLEAYGLDRGLRKCEIMLQDFKECTHRQKQVGRAIAMRTERNRQISSGELSKEERYIASPKDDSF